MRSNVPLNESSALIGRLVRSEGFHVGRGSECDGIQENERTDPALESQELGHATSDVVSNNRELVHAELLQELPHVRRLRAHVESLGRWLLGVPVPDEVGNDRLESRGQQGGEIAPQVRGCWKAVQQNDRWARPLHRICHLAGRDTSTLSLESGRHARTMASTTRTTLAISITSWTRTMCAPFATIYATAPAVPSRRSVTSVPWASPMNDFRDVPTSTGRPRSRRASFCCMSRRECSVVLPKPRPGSTQNRSHGTPASTAACNRLSK